MSNVIIDGIAYIVEIIPGTDVTLSDLDHDQLVRWGDGKTNHERLTPLKRKLKQLNIAIIGDRDE